MDAATRDTLTLRALTEFLNNVDVVRKNCMAALNGHGPNPQSIDRPKVLISYAWENDPNRLKHQQYLLRILKHHMESANISAFLDLSNMLGNVEDQMKTAVESCDVMFVIGTNAWREKTSPEKINHTNAGKELKFALERANNERDFHIYPLVVEGEPHDTLASIASDTRNPRFLYADFRGIVDIDHGPDAIVTSRYIPLLTQTENPVGLIPAALGLHRTYSDPIHQRYQRELKQGYSNQLRLLMGKIADERSLRDHPLIPVINSRDLKIENRIGGNGAFGDVSAATWKGLEVAVKEILSEDPEFEQKFNLEAAALFEANSPMVVRVYGMLRDSNRFCLVMERLPYSLAVVLENQSNSLTWTARFQILLDVALGLQGLHQNGIIHENLTTHNILIDTGMRAKLSDFGMSEVRSYCLRANRGHLQRADVRQNIARLGDIMNTVVNYNSRPGDCLLGALISSMSQKEIDLSVIIRSLEDSLIISQRGIDSVDITFSQARMIPTSYFVDALATNESNPYIYRNLGLHLLGGHTVVFENQNLTARRCFEEAATLDPTYSNAFVGLGCTLAQGESVTLGSQRFSQMDCFRKAIQLDDHNSMAFLSIGVVLPPGGIVPNLRLNQQQCFVKAISLDPSNSLAYFNLGATLAGGRRTSIRNGRRLSERECYIKAIELDPSHSMSYNNLGLTLSRDSDEVIQLVNLMKMNRRQCFAKAIELDPSNHLAYYHLGISLRPGDRFSLTDRSVVQLDCFLQAYALGYRPAHVYYNIGRLLDPGQFVELDRRMNEQDCYLRAISLDRNYSFAYNALGTTLNRGSFIQVEDRRMDDRACFLEAIRLDETNSDAYVNLASVLTDSENVLVNGRSLNKESCLSMALELNPNRNNLS